MTVVYKEVVFFIIVPAALFVICEDFELKILHTNDVHAHVEQFNKHGGPCTGDTSKCFGGVARRHTVIEQIRNSTKNVILLDGGDQFEKTIWFRVYKGAAAVRFMNYIKYDAMAIGNHEFDDGPEGLIKFLKTANFTVLSSNMDVSKEPKWPTPDRLYKRSVVIERSGRKIGLIGYTTPETKWKSNSGNVQFMDEITSIQKEVDKLKNEGVNILIAVGHSGFQTDQEIAKNVKDLDVVVGGHTNTFLYNGPQPSVDKIEGPYPTVITRVDSSKCLVVQDFQYGKYLGNLNVIFDVNGMMKSWNGNPIMLNASYKQDENVLRMVHEMAVPIMEARNTSVGSSLVYLQGSSKVCSIKECNLGNLVADAVVRYAQINPEYQRNWGVIRLGLWNGGGIRSEDIDKKGNESITLAELMSIFRLGNNADIIEIKGKYLMQAFEFGVSKSPKSSKAFPQVSGFKIKFDSTKQVGSRLTEVLALCADCRVPEYKLLDTEKIYKVVVSSFLADGREGFNTSLSKYERRYRGHDALLPVRKYVEQETPISPAIEGRMVDVSSKTVKKNECQASGSAINTSSMLSLMVCLFSFNFVTNIFTATA